MIRVAVACLAALAAHAADEAKIPRAPYMPAALPEASWHRKVAEEQNILTNRPVQVALIGDSLTEFWTFTGAAVWNSRFVPLKCADLGIAGDRTEQILWRIENLDFRRARPKVFVLLMGTNNLGMEPPDAPQEVVRAVLRAVVSLTKRFPASSILVMEIPPSGFESQSPLRQRIQKTNALLAQNRWPGRARVVPMYAAFVDDKDQWKPGATLDGTHFSASGYEIFAGLLAKEIETELKGN